MTDWIPMESGRRPKEREECLITLHGNVKDVVIHCVYLDRGFCVTEHAGLNMSANIPLSDYAVLAWMPLPEPYKEGENG